MICLKGRQPQLARLLCCAQCEHEMSNHDASDARSALPIWDDDEMEREWDRIRRRRAIPSFPSAEVPLSTFSKILIKNPRGPSLTHVHDPTRSGAKIALIMHPRSLCCGRSIT